MCWAGRWLGILYAQSVDYRRRAGKLHCDYVRPDYEPVVRAEIQTYRR